MDDTKVGILKEGLRSNFWKVLSQEIDEEFKKNYGKLRTCKGFRDSTFFKLQGFLDALEWVQNRPNGLIDEMVREDIEDEE